METDLTATIISLPYDAITLILLKLSVYDLGRITSVNNLFNQLVNQNLVWKHRYLFDYKGKAINYDGNWKDLYKKALPMINLKNKSFVYRVTSKSFRMPKQNATIMADWHCSQNVALVHWTQYNRGSYADNELLSIELMDLNNLTYTPVKSTLPRMTYIPVGNYFAGFRKSQSAGTGSVYIFKKELDLPGQPLFVLRRESDGRRPNLSTEGKYLVHYSVTMNRTMDIGTHVSAKIYDFETSGETPIATFSFNGNVWQFTEDYIIHTSTGDYSNEVRVFEWRKVNSIVHESDDMVFLHEHTVKCVSIYDHKLLCYSAVGPCNLTLWDIHTQQKIKEFATFPLVKCLGVSLAYINNFCYIGIKKTQDVWKHAFFDLDREDLVRVFELDGDFSSLLPLEDENNRFSGKFLVTTTENDGILDLCHPMMTRTFDVLIVPPTVGNVSTLDATKLARRSVTYGRMLEAFVDICQCPNSLFLDSQVVYLEPNKKRYTLIFNGKHVTEPSPSVTLLVRESKIEHYRNTPVQGLEFGLSPAKKPNVPRFSWRKNNPDSPTAASLIVYGPCVLMQEVWIDGAFVPETIGKEFRFDL